MQEKKQITWIIVGAVVVIVIIGLLAYFNKSNQTTGRAGFYEGEMNLEKLAEISTCPLTADKDAFAKCLTEKGWVMYGAEWCAHCKAQKALFGEAFQYIKYIECPDNIDVCLAAGINGYPTWKIEK